jgi:hypothetical protein
MSGLIEVRPDGERLPERSARALADLARAAYSLLNKPMMQVNFEVHHAVDNPGYLDRLKVVPYWSWGVCQAAMARLRMWATPSVA